MCHWFVDSTTVPLSYARRELIRKSHTAWFLFADDDVEWSADQLKSLLRIANLRQSRMTGALETQIRVPGKGYHFKTSLVTRGWTGFTLIRRSVVKDWAPPPIQRYEDEHLRRHILGKGYAWRRIMNLSVTHHIHDRQFRDADHYLDGRGAKYALPPFQKAFMLLKTPLFIFHGPTRLRYHLYFLSGMLS